MITQAELDRGIEIVKGGELRTFAMTHSVLGKVIMSYCEGEFEFDLGAVGFVWCDEVEIVRNVIALRKGPDTIAVLNTEHIEVAE